LAQLNFLFIQYRADDENRENIRRAIRNR